MKKPIRIILKIVGALCLSGFIALGFLQRDPWINQRVERMIADSMTEILGVPFHMKLSSIDLMGGRISLENVAAASKTSSWSVYVPRVDLDISWLSAVRHHACALDIILYEPRLLTAYDHKKWAIVDPFLALIYAPTELPVFLRSSVFHGASLVGTTEQMKISGSCSGSTVIGPRVVSTKIVLDDGNVIRNKAHLASALSGSIEIDNDRETLTRYTVATHLSGDVLTSSGHVRSTVFGSYKDEEGSWAWYPADRSLLVTAEKVRFDNTPKAHIRAEGAVAAFAPYVPISFLRALSGAAVANADVELHDEDLTYDGSVVLTEPGYAGWSVQHGQIVFKGNLHRAEGTIALGQEAQSPLAAGSWTYDLDHSRFDTHLKLKKRLEVAQVALDKDMSEGTLTYADGKLHAMYALGLVYPTHERASIKGTVASDSKVAHIRGSWGTAPYDFTVQLDPLMIRAGKSMYANSGRGKKRFELSDTAKGVRASVDFDFLKEIARTLKLDGGYSVSGQAQVTTHAMFSSSGRPTLTVDISQGTIKIPTKHNVLQSLTGTFEYDPIKRRLAASDLSLGLYKGVVSSTAAYFDFTSSGQLSYAYVPLTCHNVFISPHKGFFGNFSGYVVAQYLKGRWLCQGSLTLDKAQLRSNLLSSQVQHDLLAATADWTKNIDLALQLHTRGPLVVKTTFFQTHAHIKGTINGTAAKPTVAATIELSDGSFAFPYRPLYITAGKLFLSPQQPNDPLIELTAKNTIKKYTITMHVTGSVHQPKISFDSSPHVPEESILTLLFSGSDGPLASAMPNIIMSQVENVLFGSDEKLTKAQQFFKGLLKPLKNVRLLPTISEEGKGIKGAIEVDINDRLRAKAQNSLDLSDETQLEVEYSLSDDMTVKAVRDEKGSLGGELEMRWKF